MTFSRTKHYLLVLKQKIVSFKQNQQLFQSIPNGISDGAHNGIVTVIEEFDAKVSEDDPNGLRGFTCSVAVGWRKFVLGTTTTFFVLVKRDAF